MQFVIDFKDDTPFETIHAYLEKNKCEVKSVFSSFSRIYVVEADTMPPHAHFIDAMAQDD